MDKDRRRELTAMYKEMETYMGVVKITNTVSGKIHISAYPNLKNKWHSIKLRLQSGLFVSAELQLDWNALGEEAFTYEVLEQKSTKDMGDVRWEMKQMEAKWLEELQPYGEKGYNKQK